MSHPCQSCGACCASFRVAFHWSESAPELGGGTPAALTARLDAHRVAMRGTFAEPIRCIALAGLPGRATACTIYASRPSPCRELQASWEHGVHVPQCDRARARHGLAPLTPATWPAHSAATPADPGAAAPA
jgi:hypothetical protein